jgi:methyltransferase-like protein
MEDLNKRFEKNENMVFRKIGSETLLVPITNDVGDMGSIYHLNEIGAFVWERLDGKQSLFDIQNRILEEFKVSSTVAKKDLLDFMGQLKEIGALVAAEE